MTWPRWLDWVVVVVLAFQIYGTAGGASKAGDSPSAAYGRMVGALIGLFALVRAIDVLIEGCG